MAQREIIVELRLDNQQSVRNLGAYKAELLKVNDSIRLLNSIIRENGTANARQERQLGELTAKARNLSSQIRELSNDLSGATAAGLRFRDKMADAARAGLGAFGLNILGVTAAITSAVRVFQDAGRTIVEFDQGLANLRALSPDAAARIDDIAEAVKSVGIAFGFTAKQSLDATEELVKAGISVDDILGGALEGTLTLAASGELEVGRAAELAAIAMTQFSLKGQDVAHVADLLSAGANKALGSVDELGEALKFIGPVAANMNVTLDETVGTLALFAQSGIKGEQAGTSLRGVISALTSPSATAAKEMERLGIATADGGNKLFDAQGKFLGLANLAEVLRENTKDLTQEERAQAFGRIFGNQQLTAANILYKSGAEEVKGWTDAVNDSGIAQEVAGKKTDSLNGSLNRLSAAYDAFILSLNSGQGVIQSVLDTLTNFIQFFTTDDVERGIENFADTAVGILKEKFGLFNATATEEIQKLAQSAFLKADSIAKEASKDLEFALNRREELLQKIDAAEEDRSQNGRIRLAILMAQYRIIADAIAKAEQASKSAGKATGEAADGVDELSGATAKGTANIEANTKALDDNLTALIKQNEERLKLLSQPVDTTPLDPLDNTLTPVDNVDTSSTDIIQERKLFLLAETNDLQGQLAELDKEWQRGNIESWLEYAQMRADIEQKIVDQHSLAQSILFQSASNLLSGLAQLSEENLDTQKGLAVTQALINTFLGVTEVLSTKSVLPEPAASIHRGLAIAGVLLMGLGAVKKIQGLAEGGIVRGPGTTTSDSIPVRLSRDEFVIRARAAKVIGYDLLEELNSLGGGIRRRSRDGRYAGGGSVGGGTLTFAKGRGIAAPPTDQLIRVQHLAETRAQELQPVLVLEHLNTVAQRAADLVRISEG